MRIALPLLLALLSLPTALGCNQRGHMAGSAQPRAPIPASAPDPVPERASAPAPVPPAEQVPVAPPNGNEDERPAGRRFTGTLRGGVIAVGAETTGWVLETADRGRVDVDVSNAAEAAEKLEGRRVVIEGDLVTVQRIERGAKPMIIADSIVPAEGDDQGGE